MPKQDQFSYHSRRAASEFNLGLDSRSGPAARAHLQLASMHMQRLRELAGSSSPHAGLSD
jgi:hypothetical protein